MKRLFSLIPVLVLAFSVMAQPPKGPASKGMTFGEKTTAAGAVNADELSTILAGKPSLEVKVKGKVVEVCKMMGCWLKIQTHDGTVMIKMKDESFMVPLAINGKTVIANGIVTFKETSVEMLRHYAEDAGKPKEEIAAINEPKKEMTMQATGILVL
ncbi:MAG: DUF4920 domain-containing protein [Ferruginibacter sp.]